MVKKWFAFLKCYGIFWPNFPNKNASFGFKWLITLIIFSILGSFFGALITSVRREGKEGGWFKFKKQKLEDK